MNNKEIVKHFYEYVVSENRIDQAVRFLSAVFVEEMGHTLSHSVK